MPPHMHVDDDRTHDGDHNQPHQHQQEKQLRPKQDQNASQWRTRDKIYLGIEEATDNTTAAAVTANIANNHIIDRK